MSPTVSAKRRATPEARQEVEAYLASLPADARNALQKLRRAIRAAAPGAVDAISYGLPAFKLDGRVLVCYRAAKDHCSLHPMSASVIRTHAAELRAYGTSKGTIRFGPEKTLPSSLVRAVIATRIAELQKRK
jgi:uncharacterized protein YdhG (YjbR/CyaY superfamily)